MAPGCEPEQPRRPPSILSPPAGQIVVLAPHLSPSDQELPFEAESEAASTRHAWFVDGRLLGTIAPHERLWWTPSAGVHELLVQDETGLSARRRLEVRTAAELAGRVGAGGGR